MNSRSHYVSSDRMHQRTSRMASWILHSVVACVLLVVMATATGAQDCEVMYRKGGKSLIFGGLYENCQANCQSRDTYWGQTCAFRPGTSWGVCSYEQAANAFEITKTVGGGEILKITPCHITRYVAAGRTLWLIGDSHSKTLYRALQCFLIDFWDHQECQASPDWNRVQELSNLPAARGQSKCFHLFNGGRICMVHAVLGTSLVNNPQVASGGVLPLLQQKFARRGDIFYINFGVWHKKRDDWRRSYGPALEALGQYYQATKRDWPHMLFWETPAEHPKDRSGSSCMPMRGYRYNTGNGRLEVDAASRVDVQGWNSGATLNGQARTTLTRFGIPIVPAYNVSVPLADNHIGWVMNPELDCLHYCQNGLPQAWVFYLFNAMRNGRGGVREVLGNRGGAVSLEASRTARFQCVPSTEKF